MSRMSRMSRMWRLKLWLTICGLVTLGAGGALGFLVGSRVAGSASRPATNGGLLLPEYSSYWLLRSEEIWDELGLRDEQKSRIDEVLADYYTKDRDLREDLNELAGDAHGQLVATLTAEQLQKFTDIQRRYSEARLEAEVIREVALMRREIDLSAQQEPNVFRPIYDSFLERREYFRSLWKRKEKRQKGDRDRVRRKFKEISARLFDRLESILSSEQLAGYRSFCERRNERHRAMRKGRRGRGKRGEKGDKNAAEGAEKTREQTLPPRPQPAPLQPKT